MLCMLTQLRDVTSKESINQVHIAIQNTLPEIGGVVNGATVIRDSWLSKTSFSDWQDILAPKVQGSLLLGEQYRDVGLDFFILMGSIAGHMGNISQSAYAAANSFLLSLGRQRKEAGMVASVLSPGPILGVGYVANADSKLTELLNSSLGCYNLSEHDLHELFAEAILAGRPQSGRNPDIAAGFKMASPKSQPGIKWYQITKAWNFIDSSVDVAQASADGDRVPLMEQLDSAKTSTERVQIIEAAFIAKVTKKLMLSEGTVSREVSLVELGVDSLVAVELRSWLAKEAGLLIPTLKMLGGSSIGQLIGEHVQ